MPLWTIHHTPGVFTESEKQQLASRITDYYEKAGLPRFYVVAVFNEVTPLNMYVGGEPARVAVRIVIEHIARRSADTEHRQRIARFVKSIVEPFMTPHDGMHWEFHINETSEELWMINGIVPPKGGSDTEREWAAANAATAY
jgi:phenylpyruvate tautomerase PptA (4-oxalocrotonate tautomerase family)